MSERFFLTTLFTIGLLGLLMSMTARAESCISCSLQELQQDVNTPVPKGLEDAEIIVRTKDGKEHKMSANSFKVVPRKQQFKVTERTVVLEPKQPIRPTPRVEERAKLNKHIISITGNRSVTDYDVDNLGGGSIKIANKYEFGVGLMYQHNVTGQWYLGAHGDTHKTFGGSLGYGF